MPFFWYFWAWILKNYIIFEISTLKFVKNESLTHTVNFGIGSAFSKGSGSAFFEGPGPSPGQGPLYKVCDLVSLCSSLSMLLKVQVTLVFWTLDFWKKDVENITRNISNCYSIFQTCRENSYASRSCKFLGKSFCV